MHGQATASNHLAKANRAIHCSRVRAEERVKKVRRDVKENPKVPKVRTRVKPRNLVCQVLKARNQRQAQKLRNLHIRTYPTDSSYTDNLRVMMAGVAMNGMMTGVRLDGMLG